MIILPIADRENSRVEMVRSFALIEKPRVPLHDEVAALARDLAGASTALVSLVGGERNWFAGAANFTDADQCRWSSFCTHVVAEPDSPLWVEDARADFRFAGNPYVIGEPWLRFYAGMPIVVNDFAVGSLCVIDSNPRPYDPELTSRLGRLARIVGDDLASRHQVESLRQSLLASADALIDCDDQGIITQWSGGAARLFGFPEAEAVGQNITLIVPPEHVEAHTRGFDHWRRSGIARLERRIELNGQCKDGSQIEIELWMSVSHVNGVRHVHSNIRDISDRKRQAAELLAAKMEAEAANVAKSTFLTNMSHELRTPLNGVIGVTDLLARTPLTPHQADLISIVQSSSDQLRRLVGDILDLARIESGEIVLTQSPFSLAELIDDVRNLSALAAQAKGLSLVVDVSLAIPGHVMGDALRLKQVLTNLVSNAVKFTAAGSVTVTVTRADSAFRFEVSDTGIGFDDRQRAFIFDRFHQADDSITRKFGGTGLGLAISRELITTMGGRLDCSSTPDEGATFWFTLPLDIVEAGSMDSPPVEEAGFCAGRVLVVDDNATNRRVAELLLQSVEAEVVCVEDGAQAVEAFRHGRFDVILMDMMMPVMDGIAATQAIRQSEQEQHLPRTPIVMLTANTLPEHVAASLAAGADIHLAKPVNAAGLFETLGRLGTREAAVPAFAEPAPKIVN